ncbi:SigE family RNA polymerase sigma factor [Catellatospora sp. NPDC049609]|uniref:SigE family RNA polymerase sigma factor n=1 Tax=Catellatospora sp. NPDC049609 TaxID=3155505 RepID=UPI0034126930
MHPEFEHYVRARSGALVGFAYLLCRDRHLAEDLVQEVLARAYHRWDRIESGNPDVYLRRALVWANSSWWRRLSHRERPQDSTPDTAADDDFVQRHAVRDELWALLGTLPRRQRMVLVLRFFEDLDDDRIAELLDCSPTTVRVHAHRGLAALRTRLSEPVPAPSAERAFPAVAVEAVRRRATGVRRRRTALAGAAAAVVATLIVLLPGWRSAQPPPVLTPTPTPSASPSASPSTVALVPRPAAQRLPEFPYQPGFLPARVGPLSVVAALDMTGVESAGSPAKLLVYAGPTEYDWDWEAAQTTPVDVGGLPGTLRTGRDENGAQQVGLTWRRDGRWVTVQSFGGLLTVAEVERFARELRPGRMTATPLITYGLMPEGYEVSSLDRGHVCLSREPRLTPADPEGLCVVTGQDPNLVSLASSLSVGGVPAALEWDAEGRIVGLNVQLDERRVLLISQSRGDLGEEDLIRFAGSITLAEPAGQ